jgi:hypothetical protein
MASISPQAVAKIRGRVADWTADDATIAAELNAPTLPNPEAAPTVPRPFAASDVLGLLAVGSLARLRNCSDKAEMLREIDAQNRPGVMLWASLLAADDGADIKGVITPAERDAIFARMAETAPDPAYRPLLSWAEAEVGRPLDPSDVAAARPNGG